MFVYRYLWASLQLEAIFPTNSNVIVTDELILNLITNLPRDLPEAFEQALERIPDRQYEGRIMKLVLSAATPLDLDQIRIALCVDIGEMGWHPERIPKDGMQVLALSGGNLLERDEEDGKIRFIHHSVFQHLISPASSPVTSPYHFTIEDAENYVGAVCVTYLHLPVLDSRITVTRNFQSTKILDEVVESTQRSLPIASRVIEHIKSREHKRGRPTKVEIGQMISQIQAARTQQNLDPRCLADYAIEHWIFHTRFFDAENQDSKKSWSLLWRLLYGRVALIKQPCPDLDGQPFPVLVWAVERGHGSLFRAVLSASRLHQSQVVKLIQTLKLHSSIRGVWLGDIMAQYIQSLRTIEMPSTANDIKTLLDLGANAFTYNLTSNSEPLKDLLHRLFLELPSSGLLQEFTSTVYAHPAILRSPDKWSLFGILERLKYWGQQGAVAKILNSRPELNFGCRREWPDPYRAPKRLIVQDKLPVEEALDLGDWEYVETYGRDQLNCRTSCGTSLLCKAIESMSDAWVCHLLNLGADANAGPFMMRQHPDIPALCRNCFPLEAALWLRRTRVCLALLRSGAAVGRGHSLIRAARETGNWILLEKFYEQPTALFQARQDPSGHWKPYEHERTALSTACKTLSYGNPGEPPGFPKPLLGSKYDYDWMWELETIISRLALDGNAEYVNTQDTDGRAALHHLAEAKHVAVQRLHTLVNLLLSRGANPDLPDIHGQTPFQLALSCGAPFPGIEPPPELETKLPFKVGNNPPPWPGIKPHFEVGNARGHHGWKLDPASKDELTSKVEAWPLID